jgi:hypothetical protein
MGKRIHNSGTRGYNAFRSTESIDKRDNKAVKSSASSQTLRIKAFICSTGSQKFFSKSEILFFQPKLSIIFNANHFCLASQKNTNIAEHVICHRGFCYVSGVSASRPIRVSQPIFLNPGGTAVQLSPFFPILSRTGSLPRSLTCASGSAMAGHCGVRAGGCTRYTGYLPSHSLLPVWR